MCEKGWILKHVKKLNGACLWCICNNQTMQKCNSDQTLWQITRPIHMSFSLQFLGNAREQGVHPTTVQRAFLRQQQWEIIFDDNIGQWGEFGGEGIGSDPTSKQGERMKGNGEKPQFSIVQSGSPAVRSYFQCLCQRNKRVYQTTTHSKEDHQIYHSFTLLASSWIFDYFS